MPNEFAQASPIRNYFAGQDDAAAVRQQNSLNQMRDTQFQQQNQVFGQGQQDRAKMQRQQDILGTMAADSARPNHLAVWRWRFAQSPATTQHTAL